MNERKNVLVTGAGGGLGIPVVTRLLNEGWHVFAFLRSEKQVDKMRQLVPDPSGRQLAFITGDVTREEDIRQAVEQIRPPDALVHLAGGFKGAATFAEQDPEVFDQMFALNTRSSFLLLRALLPVMKENKKGAIVMIGAKPAVHPGTENAVYAASKAALINFTLTAAEEGRQHDVRANVIVPAVIRTQANTAWASSPEETEKWTPPEDIARIIAWLISDQGASVTGTVIPMYHHIKA